jgi:RNA polymerase sigma-70 factor (ECF subfamily)
MAISREAFGKQVLALVGSLHGVARRLTGNDTDAEDLVAESVARAWKALDSLESDAAFRAWIFRILHNTFVSERRRASARPQCEPIDGEDLDEAEPVFSVFEQIHQPFLLWFSNPEQEFLDRLLREDLERSLATLPDHHRIVVILADLEEFNYQEIAATLGVPVGTVRSRLARARGALQKLLWQQAQAHGFRGDAATAAKGSAQDQTASTPLAKTAKEA